MEAKPHQVEYSKKCWDIISKLGYCYLHGKPRTGKSIISLLTFEHSSKPLRVLIICPKGAIGFPERVDENGIVMKDTKGKEKIVENKNSRFYRPEAEKGWLKTLKECKNLTKTFDLTTYERLGKIVKQGKKKIAVFNFDRAEYDAVIIDESHNLGVVGKANDRYRLISYFCKDLPHLHLSGTSIVETPNSIYHQMAISKFNPFKNFKNFFDFFRTFGVPYTVAIQGIEVPQYDKCKTDKLMPIINQFSLFLTQEDAGISSNVMAKDIIHYVDMDEATKKMYNTFQKDKVWELEDGYMVLGDTTTKLRMALHLMESGAIIKTIPDGDKLVKEYYFTGIHTKAQYILDTFGDDESVGIMTHFIPERIILQKMFKKARIFSSTTHAEGVDLSYLKKFVIMSSDYRGAKFIQRKERIINMEGSNTFEVHHILVKGGISEQVFKTCSKKEDFNNKTYRKTKI